MIDCDGHQLAQVVTLRARGIEICAEALPDRAGTVATCQKIDQTWSLGFTLCFTVVGCEGHHGGFLKQHVATTEMVKIYGDHSLPDQLEQAEVGG